MTKSNSDFCKNTVTSTESNEIKLQLQKVPKEWDIRLGWGEGGRAVPTWPRKSTACLELTRSVWLSSKWKTIIKKKCVLNRLIKELCWDHHGQFLEKIARMCLRLVWEDSDLKIEGNTDFNIITNITQRMTPVLFYHQSLRGAQIPNQTERRPPFKQL